MSKYEEDLIKTYGDDYRKPNSIRAGLWNRYQGLLEDSVLHLRDDNPELADAFKEHIRLYTFHNATIIQNPMTVPESELKSYIDEPLFKGNALNLMIPNNVILSFKDFKQSVIEFIRTYSM